MEKKYRDLISNLTDIVIEIDSEGNFIYISPQVYDTFGYKPEEALGLNGFDFIHPDDFESAAKYFEKVLDGEQVYSVEYRAKHKDGHFFPVSVTGRMVREEDE
ncbi:MAG: PAS domain S-box protein [Candidatus Hermodarchaeota archaeon]